MVNPPMKCKFCRKAINKRLIRGVTPAWFDSTGHVTCDQAPYTNDPMVHIPMNEGS